MPQQDIFDTLDEESPRKDIFDELESEPVVPPSKAPAPFSIPEGVPTQVTPEQLEQLYQSGELRRPPDWDAVRKRIGLQEEGTAYAIEGAALEGLQRKLYEPNLPRDLLAQPLEQMQKEGEAFRAQIPSELRSWDTSPIRPQLSDASRESQAAAEALSGTVADLSSGEQLSILGAAALSGGLPGMAGRMAGAAVPATFGVEGVKSIVEGAETLLSDDATPEARGQAKAQIGLGATMLPGFGGLVKRPTIPPRIIEAIAKADAVGLKRAAQAYADTVKQSQRTAAITAVETKPTEVSSAIQEQISDPSLLRQERPEVELQGVREPQVEAAIPREPARAQSGAQPEVLLTGPEVIKSIVELPDAEAGALRQKPAVEAGMKLTEADVPALEAARDSALKQAVEAAERGDNEAFKAGFGKNIWFSGAIEGARRKGPNYDTFIKEQKAAGQTQPEVARAGEQAARSPDVLPTERIPEVQSGAAPIAPPAPEAVTARSIGDRPAGRPAVGAAEAAAKLIEAMTLEEARAAASPIYAKMEAIPENQIYVPGSRGERMNPEYKALSDAVKPYARRIESLEHDVRAAEIKVQNERNYEARVKRIAEAPVYQRVNGWDIVKDGVNYVLRDPFTKEDVYYGKLSRAREVGKESQPEPPAPAQAQAVSLPSAEAKLSQVVNRTIEQSSPTRLGVSPAATMRPTDVVLGAPDLRSISPAVEARWQAAVKGTEGIIEKVKANATEAWKSVTREYADLPPREFPAEIDVLRRLRASRNASARTAVDVLKGVTHNLGPKQYGVFNRVALLEDLVKDVESGKYATGNDLPFGYKDAGELTADLSKFRSVAEATPQIKAALERRQEFMDSLRSTLVERGFLPESILQDPRYFHHQVLLYMAEKNAPTGSRSFRDWFSGWQKKRTGSSQDYNRQYVEAEAEVLSDAFNKIAMQDLQGEMRGISDLTAELKELHGAEWRQHIPKTHTEWQPKRGNAFYPVQTVAERVMDRYLSGLGEILPSEFKEALAMGGRKQEWVIPKPLAKVLDNIAPRPDNWISRLATTAQNSWKRYILLNPLRAAKYNLNNLSGDLDFLFAAQPKIFKEFKNSASDMWGFHVKGKSAVGDIKEAMQDGVIGSGWRASELPDIARSDYFNWLTGEKPKLVERYWDWIGKRSDAREDTGRLASYRFAKKEWEAGRPFYGASVPADVNALATPRLKAAKVAREILIDYGRGTEFSNFTRQKLVPFFKWMEGNFVRYQQLIRNIPEHEGAGPRVAGATGKKAATLGLRMGAAYGIINLWNHMFFPKEEEELGEARNQLHLILGRDEQGNVQTIRFQGALSDLLGWVGGEDLPQDVKDLTTGKASVGDKMEDAYEAGISRAVNASLPFPKTAAEIGLGRSFYPNALSPRPVRDKAEHAAGLFSLKPVYQWLAGKPHKPLRQELANLISYTTDPGEAAYNTTRHMAGEWLEDQGEERASVIPGKRSNALYYYKQALRYKDQATAQKFLDEYNRLGGSREGLTQSIKASAPLSMLGSKSAEFLNSLSPQEREAVRRGEEWYQRVYNSNP